MSDKQYICPSCAEVDGLAVRNVSGEVETVGDTVRHTERGDQGRFVPRRSTQVGALGPPGGTGPGGVDSVSGKHIPGVANNAVLFRDPMNWERITHDSPDYRGYPAISRLMDSGQYPRTRRA
jgi:hypothetical protein